MAYFNRNIPEEITADSQTDLKQLFLVDFENVHDDGLVGIDALQSDDHVVIFFGPQIKSISFESHIAVMQSKAQIENMKTIKSAKNYLDFQLSTYLGFLVGKNRYDSIVIISKDTGFDSVVDFWTKNGVPAARRPQISEDVPGKATRKSRSRRKSRSAKNSKAQDAPAEEKTVVESAEAKPTQEPADNTAPKATAASKPSKKSRKSETAEPKATGKSKKSVDPPEAVRKRLRAAFADLHLPSANYSIIYKAFAHSPDKLALNNSLQKSFGARGGAIYKAAKGIFAEYKNTSDKEA